MHIVLADQPKTSKWDGKTKLHHLGISRTSKLLDKKRYLRCDEREVGKTYKKYKEAFEKWSATWRMIRLKYFKMILMIGADSMIL